MQNIVSFIGLFCKRDLSLYRSYGPKPPHRKRDWKSWCGCRFVRLALNMEHLLNMEYLFCTFSHCPFYTPHGDFLIIAQFRSIVREFRLDTTCIRMYMYMYVYVNIHVQLFSPSIGSIEFKSKFMFFELAQREGWFIYWSFWFLSRSLSSVYMPFFVLYRLYWFERQRICSFRKRQEWFYFSLLALQSALLRAHKTQSSAEKKQLKHFDFFFDFHLFFEKRLFSHTAELCFVQIWRCQAREKIFCLSTFHAGLFWVCIWLLCVYVRRFFVCT